MSYKITPELDRLFDSLIGDEKKKIYDQIGFSLPNAIRFNPLKGPLPALRDLLFKQGFRFAAFPGFDNSFRIEYQPYPIGKSLSHYLGHIYVQDIASMLPPLVLDPQPGEWILDMSAAPGSKTTQIAALMGNTGVVIANDVVMKRIRSLAGNLERMGVVNAAVFRLFGEQLGNQYFEVFDRVLLDPPCTGLGTLHKSPEVLSWWTPHHCQRMAASQKSLMISAVKALRPGGVLCYSTCTLTPEENEEIINFALKEFPVELETFSIPALKLRPGLTKFEGKVYHPDLQKTSRLYPVENESEGFFIARLRKTASMKDSFRVNPEDEVRIPFIPSKKSPVKKYLDYLAEHFQMERDVFSDYVFEIKHNITFCGKEMNDFRFRHKVIQKGLIAAKPMTQGAKFTTGGVHLFGYQARANIVELPGLEELEKFVNREAMDISSEGKGQIIVKYNDCIIGYALADKGMLKSQFPKGQWPFKLLAERK